MASEAVGLMIAGAVSSPSIMAPWSEAKLLTLLIMTSSIQLRARPQGRLQVSFPFILRIVNSLFLVWLKFLVTDIHTH